MKVNLTSEWKRMTMLGLTGAAMLAAGASSAQESAIMIEQDPAAPTSTTPMTAIVSDHASDVESPLIDLAICLDTSGSMSGLIDATKIKLWDIVNDLATAKPTPTLRVALLTFGNDGHNPEDGWVRIDSGLTDDLDLISERLFALTTNGGTEYVGRVLHNAVGQLEWSAGDDPLRIIVVAGNESADQDAEYNFRDVCRNAIETGIMVNSIYCGNPNDNLAPAWREVATTADGHFAAIDHNEGTIVITTPFDDQLATLSASVNETYIPFGEQGAWGMQNQTAQDSNAQTMNSAAVASRAQTKGGALYKCSWDLVDACNAGDVKIETVKVEDLPENMQKMTMEERLAYVNKMNEEREAIQRKIQEVGQQREAYIREEMKKQANDPSRSLDYALKNAIRQQAASKGLKFESIESTESIDGEADASGSDVEAEEAALSQMGAQQEAQQEEEAQQDSQSDHG